MESSLLGWTWTPTHKPDGRGSTEQRSSTTEHAIPLGKRLQHCTVVLSPSWSLPSGRSGKRSLQTVRDLISTRHGTYGLTSLARWLPELSVSLMHVYQRD